jgi:hypothetical protein
VKLRFYIAYFFFRVLSQIPLRIKKKTILISFLKM